MKDGNFGMDDFDDGELGQAEMPFQEARAHVNQAGQALELGDLVLAIRQLGLAFSAAIAESEATTDDLRAQIDDYLGHQQATLWLHEPSLFPSSTVNGLINQGNTWLGFGDITFNTGGTNRDFSDLAAALSQFVPLPPLPDDPRHRRKVVQARERSAR